MKKELGDTLLQFKAKCKNQLSTIKFSVMVINSSKIAENLPSQFLLDEELAFLNHGSFGACPREVHEQYQRIQRRLESQPVRFMQVELPTRDGLRRVRFGLLRVRFGVDQQLILCQRRGRDTDIVDQPVPAVPLRCSSTTNDQRLR